MDELRCSVRLGAKGGAKRLNVLGNSPFPRRSFVRLVPLTEKAPIASAEPISRPRRPLKTREERRQIVPEDIGEIAALLNDDGRQADLRDRGADALETARGNRHALERIMLGSVETQRHHQRPR